MPKSTNKIIAKLAIKYATDAAEYFPNVDDGALRIQIAAALLKATQMQDIFNKLFTDDMVDRLFPDGENDPDSNYWDLV
jgi:hypothetical protein